MMHLKPYIIPEYTVLLHISIISNIIPIHFSSEATTLSCKYLQLVRLEKNGGFHVHVPASLQDVRRVNSI